MPLDQRDMIFTITLGRMVSSLPTQGLVSTFTNHRCCQNRHFVIFLLHIDSLRLRWIIEQRNVTLQQHRNENATSNQ